jgi:rhamnogalacturonan acetylesterase
LLRQQHHALIAADFDSGKNSCRQSRRGRSSRTSLTEGLWGKVLAEMKPDDFVMMQFDRNDAGKIEGKYPNGRASIKGNGEETQEVTHADGKKETVHSYGW